MIRRPGTYTAEERESMFIDVARRFGHDVATDFYTLGTKRRPHMMRDVLNLWPPPADARLITPRLDENGQIGQLITYKPSEDTCRCASCFFRLVVEVAA